MKNLIKEEMNIAKRTHQVYPQKDLYVKYAQRYQLLFYNVLDVQRA